MELFIHFKIQISFENRRGKTYFLLPFKGNRGVNCLFCFPVPMSLILQLFLCMFQKFILLSYIYFFFLFCSGKICNKPRFIPRSVFLIRICKIIDVLLPIKCILHIYILRVLGPIINFYLYLCTEIVTERNQKRINLVVSVCTKLGCTRMYYQLYHIAEILYMATRLPINEGWSHKSRQISSLVNVVSTFSLYHFTN